MLMVKWVQKLTFQRQQHRLRQGRVQVPDFNSGGHNGSDIVNLRYIDGIFLNKKTGGTLNNPITFLSSLPSNQRQIHNIGSPQFNSSDCQ